ncbi:MAG: ubiquinone/menaquinone biosynthesis methyltransferase [Proteobacteria bacterium]|nr:ubiquinone/menaquinone biosynthesis methyltransferase [Pseudomonadota bacterium]
MFSIPKGEKKAPYVQNRFSRIAEKYDLFNDLITQGMHRYWKRFLVGKTGLKEGDFTLDICCGTGDITERLEKVVGKSGKSIGLDFSSGMLDTARERNPSGGSDFMQGDVLKLPVKDDCLNAVTVGFGLRNLTNIDQGLNEVFRILKPGGTFLCLDMGKVKLPIIKQTFHFYFFKIVPRIGKLIYPGETFFDYFPKSSINYPSQEELADMLRKTGFINIEFFDFYFGSTVVHFARKP